MNASSSVSPYLRPISEPIIIGAVRGISTEGSHTIFTSGAENFQWWVEKPGIYESTPKTTVRVHELESSLWPAQVYESIGKDLWSLCLTRGQVELFVRENQRYLKGWKELSFLVKEGGESESREPYFVQLWNCEEAQRHVMSRYLALEKLLREEDTYFVLPEIAD